MNMEMQPPAHDVFGWIVIVVGVVVTVGVFVAAAYWTVRPGETAPDHPKRMIFGRDR
jgi:hypothetical protein